MFGWFVRLSLSLAALATGLFVPRNAPNFGMVNVVVAVLMMTAVIAVLAVWPIVVAWARTSYRNLTSGR